MLRLALWLLLLVLRDSFPDSRAQSSTGLEFVVVLPENVAYYYPREPRFTLYFTSLLRNATVTLRAEGIQLHSWQMQAGEVEQFNLGSHLELGKSVYSDKVIQISSNKPITVEVVGVVQNMTQSVLVLSKDQLGTNYIIPSFKEFTNTNHPLHISEAADRERSALRVIIVNTDQVNEVTLEGLSETCNLTAHRSCQVYLTSQEDLVSVRAQHPVAVLLSHTCARGPACTCRLLYTVLPPETNQPQTFLIPSTLPWPSGDRSAVLVYNRGSTTIEAYDPNSPVLSIAGTALLYQPDFLFPLIPTGSFASCYSLRGYPNTETSAVIIVHMNETDGLRLGNDRLHSPDWQPITGTDYVSARISLDEGKNILWHVSTTVGVYHMGRFQNEWFGNPAPVLSRTPDSRGCLVIPEAFEIGLVPGGWRESVAYCKNKDLELASFSNAAVKQQIHSRISAEKSDSLKWVWIGMRLRLRSGKFYWLNERPLTEMDWSDGEPSQIYDRHCVIMNVEEGFDWATEHCCMDMHPVCYRRPGLLPM